MAGAHVPIRRLRDADSRTTAFRLSRYIAQPRGTDQGIVTTWLHVDFKDGRGEYRNLSQDICLSPILLRGVLLISAV